MIKHIYNQHLQYSIEKIYNLEKLLYKINQLKDKNKINYEKNKKKYFISKHNFIECNEKGYFIIENDIIENYVINNYFENTKKNKLKNIENDIQTLYINVIKENKYKINQLPLKYIKLSITNIKIYNNNKKIKLNIEIHKINNEKYIKSYISLYDNYDLTNIFIKNEISYLIDLII